jgi:hypothetical protein
MVPGDELRVDRAEPAAGFDFGDPRRGLQRPGHVRRVAALAR